MPTYISLLRAVNVGGRVLKMADLRRCLEASGLDDVETYIQTGNVRFRTSTTSAEDVERHVEGVLSAEFGFEVPAILVSPEELRRTYEEAARMSSPFAGGEGVGRYVVFFKEGDVPDPETAAQMSAWDRPGEWATAPGRVVHVWLDRPSMQADFFGAFKQALAPGTNRNLKVVRTMAERWAPSG